MTSTPDDLAYLTSLVRESDRPRYYATLFAPAAARPDLFALYGFAVEIARVPDQVSDPTVGEIRLRWWQDSLVDTIAAGSAGSTPALRAIADTISRQRLPLAAFTAMIEARCADLYSDPPATVADLEGYLGETEFGSLSDGGDRPRCRWHGERRGGRSCRHRLRAGASSRSFRLGAGEGTQRSSGRSVGAEGFDRRRPLGSARNYGTCGRRRRATRPPASCTCTRCGWEAPAAASSNLPTASRCRSTAETHRIFERRCSPGRY